MQVGGVEKNGGERVDEEAENEDDDESEEDDDEANDAEAVENDDEETKTTNGGEKLQTLWRNLGEAIEARRRLKTTPTTIATVSTPTTLRITTTRMRKFTNSIIATTMGSSGRLPPRPSTTPTTLFPSPPTSITAASSTTLKFHPGPAIHFTFVGQWW